VSKDETDTGWKIYGGYQFAPYFAVEGGWADLGKFMATRNVTAPAAGSVSAEVEASGLFVDAVGVLPLQRFMLFGKLGAMYTNTETTRSTTGAVALFGPASSDDSELEFKMGLGASYSFTKALSIRAEWERFFEVGTEQTGEGDVDLISVGLAFRF
jgi:OOP family OmpA-OmpF porin